MNVINSLFLSMPSPLQKIIELIKKTGDRVIVFDQVNSDNSYVILAQKDYEKMVNGLAGVRGLTESELIDKINRDIAVWKSDHDLDDYHDQPDFGEELADNYFGNEPHDNQWINEYAEEAIRRASKNWTIPDSRKRRATEVIGEDIDWEKSDWLDEEDEDEDQDFEDSDEFDDLQEGMEGNDLIHEPLFDPFKTEQEPIVDGTQFVDEEGNKEKEEDRQYLVEELNF